MLDKLKSFVGIRRTVTFLLTLVFCYLSVIGKISSSEFITIFTMVIGVYFGHSISAPKLPKDGDVK